MRKWKLCLIVIFCIQILLIGFSSNTTLGFNGDNVFPSEDWIVNMPEEQGMESNIIDSMYPFITSVHLDLHSVLVARNGYIIDDRYLSNSMVIPGDDYSGVSDTFGLIRHGKLHAVFSCTKSVISLLIGIAIDNGFIDDVNQTFFDIFPNKWNPSYGNETKKDIEIEHLLTMTSGLFWSDELYGSDYSLDDWANENYSTEHLLNLTLVSTPGEDFQYSSGHVHLLSAIIQNRTNMKTSEFAQQYLFDPIGISGNDWEWDETNWDWGSGGLSDISFGGWGIWMTPRAMARIGLLCLNNGNWNGTQVISEEWISAASTSHFGNVFYGYLFWRESNYYYAAGLLWQWIVIAPSENIVTVFTGQDIDYTTGKTYDVLINNVIRRAATHQNITIAFPEENQVYGEAAPTFKIYVEKSTRNSTWYTLKTGPNVPLTGFSDSIDQQQWSNLPEGNVEITYYANDSEGHISSRTITVKKSLTPQIPGFFLPILLSVSVGVVVLIYWKKYEKT